MRQPLLLVGLSLADAITGVSLSVPSVALEGGNVSLSCTWTTGTGVTVQWDKGGSVLTSDSRITISEGSLIINPASRTDAGEYTCTADNRVSASTATATLTVYYGPDTPVLTKNVPKECVGGGDLEAGQTVRITCTSDSLPAALFTWTRDGQTVASGQPDSGVLSFQTSSTDSGRYVCTARNSITTDTSEEDTVLSVVDVCFSGGEVAGIVIGSFLGLLIIILLIVLICCVVRRRRVKQRQRENVFLQQTNKNQRPAPPDPQPNGVRDLDRGPNPPLNQHNPEHSYRAPRENRNNLQTLPLNGLNHSDARPTHNELAITNGLLHNALQNTHSNLHNGIDNPAFTHAEAPNASTLPNTQQQNPNVLIQTGTGTGGAQQPAVQVSLNPPQPNNNAQMPTINVNLNSYPTNGQQTQQNGSFPLTNTANNNPPHRQSHPRMQSGQYIPFDSQVYGDIINQPGLIPTGYTHHNRNNTVQRNANTQTYQQHPEPHRRSDGNSRRPEETATPTLRQMPWDRLRGTPAYPSGMPQRGQIPSEHTSYTSDYTSHPPIREGRRHNRSHSHTRDQTRSRTPPRRNAPSVERETRSRSVDHLRPESNHVTHLVNSLLAQRSPGTQREIRGLPRNETAPRQEATHSNNPQAQPLTTPVGHSALLLGPTTQQGLTAPQGRDTRALADPNHLQQTHMAQQQRAVPIQTPPQGLGTQPATHSAGQPHQANTAPAPNPSNLTQAALQAHTARAQTFQNRREQTQAALLHHGQQTRVAAAGAQHPPPPPPVIPLAEFETLPKERVQHRSPIRGPQPLRPPANMPVAQRPQKRTNGQHHPAAAPVNHHHHPRTGHRHAPTRGHGHTPHHGQQHTHRGRPR
ncbi:uncharacterized protein KZ484_026043 isoform 2-T2 [Pholidichthys leucotaenia]